MAAEAPPPNEIADGAKVFQQPRFDPAPHKINNDNKSKTEL